MPALPSTRLLERARYLHYSYSTEKVYLYWVRFFIRWHGLRHPRDMGASEVEAFLSMLATERRVSSSTHNQALSALLFLYREVLGLKLPWLEGIQRPASTHRIPSVLTREEIAGVLALLEGQNALVAPVAVRHGDAPDGRPAPAREGRGFRTPCDRRSGSQRQ
jgi:integrase